MKLFKFAGIHSVVLAAVFLMAAATVPSQAQARYLASADLIGLEFFNALHAPSTSSTEVHTPDTQCRINPPDESGCSIADGTAVKTFKTVGNDSAGLTCGTVTFQLAHETTVKTLSTSCVFHAQGPSIIQGETCGRFSWSTDIPDENNYLSQMVEAISGGRSTYSFDNGLKDAANVGFQDTVTCDKILKTCHFNSQQCRKDIPVCRQMVYLGEQPVGVDDVTNKLNRLSAMCNVAAKAAGECSSSRSDRCND